MSIKVALITGITGQDGSYLAEFLVAKAYRIVGAVRSLQKAQESLSPMLREQIELVEWNILDQSSITETLARFQPDEVYNFAAFSSGAGMYDEPVEIGEVNGIAVARILEAIKVVDKRIRLCQASSREIFGEATESPQNESTPVNPRSPYGAAKLYADTMVQIYRKHFGLYVCSAILFNHESPRRGLEFVTRKITNEAVKIKLGLAEELHLGNLDARRDWGFAGDYVKAMWMMLQQDNAQDFVLATGKTHSVREFCEIAFNHLGLNYLDYVREDEASFRPTETKLLVGDITKAKTELKWQPKVSFRELVRMMVDEDLNSLKNNKENGA
jgi:GDPmannose 4,6-dehydratase